MFFSMPFMSDKSYKYKKDLSKTFASNEKNVGQKRKQKCVKHIKTTTYTQVLSKNRTKTNFYVIFRIFMKKRDESMILIYF
jgi:hypothetical protein